MTSPFSIAGRALLLPVAFAALALAAAAPAAAQPPRLPVEHMRFTYRTHDGKTSYAIVLLPGWWEARGRPPLPLVIAPHGRNTLPESTAKRWRDLPTRGGFAVVLPRGQGRVLPLDSWGYHGQIDEDADEFIDFAVEGANRMRALIEDLLAYSRAGRGADPRPIDLGHVMADVLSSLAAAVADARAQVSVG